MSRKKKAISTNIGWSNASSITLFGKDFVSEILGNLNLGDMGFLELTGRIPNPNESRMFNAMVVSLVEHGLTPSSIVARMTYLGAPESLQGAVAAGLNGLGSVFVGSIEGAAKMLSESMPVPDAEADFAALAVTAVTSFRAQKRIVPGIGHPFHKPIDPRTPRLMELARETGFDGPYLKLIVAIAEEAAQRSGKLLPVNATGAIGALCCEMGFDWKICRGLGVMGRAVGLVGHILEESRNPMSEEIWHSIEARATAHMNPDAEPE
ncbi:citryl-CoA lyase [Glaciimonas sp. CA11.2]|uniref:citryl-CoA lyase n=1 Tax=unclassified Glaciimonas TaxID=2644401 RepID=UPI002AB5B514|nr:MULTISPECIES: citryl-CoA lyase [unclassified Glaciimonas]MDY7546122.1 citryl-CoA lyase [Glaciimonas sp. CA11.2]MEB0010923.1 citryl-CoA lyase [Glaciimonas sp. Cout2]MEB0081705.1 citryl-CoA lyase [Glaciimonas sp. Gout2]MEB0161818.1 citryl-CoA lyase [Glaciimonas sp. CA11.2]